MDIRPNLPIAGLAGTAQAQAKGSDSDRPAAAGGVAENQRIKDTEGIDKGSRAEDRDADGRQLLDQQPDPQRDDEQAADHSSANSSPPRAQHPPSTDPHLGHRLDFDA